MSIDPTGKRALPCFEFADTGKCSYKECKNSHDPGDIKEYKRLKEMGKDKFESEVLRYKSLGQQQVNRGTMQSYRQNSGQGTKTYPRPEIKSGSTLRGSGSTARRL